MKGLADILVKLRMADNPTTARMALNAANVAKYQAMKVSFAMTLRETGQPWEFEFVDPAKLLTQLTNESRGLQALYAAAWARSPSSPTSPWSLVVGFDEFVPGNKLSVEHSRKTMVVSFTFKELGQVAMSHGTSWSTCVVVRSNKIAEATQLLVSRPKI